MNVRPATRLLFGGFLVAAALALFPAAAADYAFERTAWAEDFLHAGNPESDANYAEIMGSGACIFDHDGDGWEDIFLLNGRYANATLQGMMDPRAALYRNVQGQRFEKVPGALEISAWGMGCATGDYDDDGDEDVALTTWGSGNQLHRNDGGGVFTNVTAAAGIRHQDCGGVPCFGASLAWIDYDKDNDLDLYVTNYLSWDGQGTSSPNMYPAQCNVLFRNEGDGTFTNVTTEARVGDCRGNHLALAIADVDKDGWQDIFIASDETMDAYLRNNGNGTFQDLTAATGLGDPRGGMGAAWGDYDGDGLYDLVITHYDGEIFALYRQNAGNFTFVDRASADGIGGTVKYVGWGADWVDIDNDADLDLVMVNGHVDARYSGFMGSPYRQESLVYRNDGGQLVDITSTAWTPAAEKRVGRALATGDLDRDGYVDVVIVNNANETASLHRSERGPNNYLSLRLDGGAAFDPHALGARVVVEAGGVRQEQEVVASKSYLSQSSRELHFGLASALVAPRVEITWPNGSTDLLTNVSANLHATFTRGGALTTLREGPIATVANATRETDRLTPVTLSGLAHRGAQGSTGSWRIGGATYAGMSATHTFSTLGAHTATFRLTQPDGAWDEATVQVTVRNVAPVAEASVPASAPRATPTRLDASASSDPDGQLVAWSWTIGGATGAPLQGRTVNATFGAMGPTTVVLVVTDADGATATRSFVVDVVNAAPVARAGPDASSNLDTPFSFDGSASTDVDGHVVAWSWDFGDNTTATGRAVQKTYTAAGVYEVRLTVTDNDGATASDVLRAAPGDLVPIARISGPTTADRAHHAVYDGSASSDVDGQVVRWSWDFGDGATAAGPIVSHRFSTLGERTILLRVEDDEGSWSTATLHTSVVNLPPRIRAPAEVRAAAPGGVALAAVGEDPDDPQATLAWTWRTGDGATLAGAQVTHAYTAYGAYEAAVSATDADGNVTTLPVRVRIAGPPVASFHAPPIADRAHDALFDASASHDPDGAIVSWTWDAGDGTLLSGKSVAHRYRALGTYAVRLTVTDNDGQSSSFTRTVAVVNLAPVALLDDHRVANVGQPLGWGLAGAYDPDGDALAWRWELAGFATSEPAPVHGFSQAGQARVRLTLTDAHGATAVAEATTRVVTTLLVDVKLDRAAWAPWERPTGNVSVRYANGAPVENASVGVAVQYRIEEAQGQRTPRLMYETGRVEGSTNRSGLLAFRLPAPWEETTGELPLYLGGPTAVEKLTPYVRAEASWRANGGAAESRCSISLDAPSARAETSVSRSAPRQL